MFAEGNRALLDRCRDRVARRAARAAPRDARMFVEFSAEDGARAQLLFQRTIPDFEPSAESYAPAVEVVEQAQPALAAIGCGRPRTTSICGPRSSPGSRRNSWPTTPAAIATRVDRRRGRHVRRPCIEAPPNEDPKDDERDNGARRSTSVTSPRDIPRLQPSRRHGLAETETGRMLALVDGLAPRWSDPTDCAGWDVKALLSHVLGGDGGKRPLRVFVQQFRGANKAAKGSGRPMIDEMTAEQVRSHARPCLRRRSGTHARARRRRGPRPRRRSRRRCGRCRSSPAPPSRVAGRSAISSTSIMNRDYWMHRVDLSRASGPGWCSPPTTTAASSPTSWPNGPVPARATLHPCSRWPRRRHVRAGTDGEALSLDAVEFCRILSGRAPRPACSIRRFRSDVETTSTRSPMVSTACPRGCPMSAPPAGFTFNQFLIDADEPLLFHTGHAACSRSSPRLSRRIMPVERCAGSPSVTSKPTSAAR